ncbi:MAG: YceI family protein [Mycobacterium sp.]
MTDHLWRLNESNGDLCVRTGVEGKAASMGHRLTIAMQSWEATVQWSGNTPVAAEAIVDVDSLRVMHGEGGVKGLSEPEKTLARSNALKTLGAGKFPQISFRADRIEKTSSGYQLTGTLEIRGKTRERVIDLDVEDSGTFWQLSCEADVRQTDFGVKPYSMLLGSMKVVDTVRVSFSANASKNPTS